jgi:hypothetical protein
MRRVSHTGNFIDGPQLIQLFRIPAQTMNIWRRLNIPARMNRDTDTVPNPRFRPAMRMNLVHDSDMTYHTVTKDAQAEYSSSCSGAQLYPMLLFIYTG